MSSLFFCLLALVQSFVAPAAAQVPLEPIDIERMKPAVTPDPFVVTEGSQVRWGPDTSRGQLGVAANHAINPLVIVRNGSIVERIVTNRTGVDLFGSVSVSRSLSLGVGIPMFFGQAGPDVVRAAGVGDLRLVPKIRLLDDSIRALGLAIIPEIRLPTHSDDEFSGGASSAAFAPKLVVDHRFSFGLRLGANAGLLLQEGTNYRNISAASEFTYSAAAELYFTGYDGLAAVGADFHGGAGLAGLDLEEAPLEGQAYLLLQPDRRDGRESDLQIHVGPSFGFLAGFGTPTFRVFGSLRWSPERDKACDCDDFRSGVPPMTLAQSDELDPNLGRVRVTIVDADTGEPIKRARARVDDEPAERTGEPGERQVDVEPGPHTLWVRARDYVPQRIEIDVPRDGELEKTVALDPIEVTVTDDKIEFTGTVYFAFDSARLEPESHDLLDAIAKTLKAYPGLELVRVEGHADARGPAAYNQSLSERRAKSVEEYLVFAGVAEERLESRGYGETRPVSKYYDKNRRVEFVIVKATLPVPERAADRVPAEDGAPADEDVEPAEDPQDAEEGADE